MHTPVYNEPPHQKVPEEKPYVLPELTVYITDACALSCTGCVTHNNFALGQHLSLEHARERIEAWAQIVSVKRLYVMGGEALLHPELTAWIEFLTKTVIAERRTIVTAGRDLARRSQDIAEYMELGWDIEVSAHSQEDYAAAQAWWSQFAREIDQDIAHEQLRDQHGITDYYSLELGEPIMQIGLRDEFYTPEYRVEEGRLTWPKLTPMRVTHRACPAKTCAYLVDGVMYSCPVQATLPRLARRYEIVGAARELAEQDLGWDPLAPTTRPVSNWFNSITGAKSQCSLCSWPRKRASIADPGLKKIQLVKRGSPAIVQESLSNPEPCEQPLDSNS
jgi:hypothetical protein